MQFFENDINRFSGLNVTIPFKTAVIPFLDHIDAKAEKIGAVNTIVVSEGRTFGYNTDYEGFRVSLEQVLESHHKQAVILGTGGASRAVAQVLLDLNIPFKKISRNPVYTNEIHYNDMDEQLMETHQIIINTTPLGMYPTISKYPKIPYQWLSEKHLAYDLIYNPLETLFLKKAKIQGAKIQNGYHMLVLQAEKSWELWQTK